MGRGEENETMTREDCEIISSVEAFMEKGIVLETPEYYKGAMDLRTGTYYDVFEEDGYIYIPMGNIPNPFYVRIKGRLG